MLAKHRSLIVFTLIALAVGLALRFIWDGYTNGAQPPAWAGLAAAVVVIPIADQLEKAMARRLARRQHAKEAGR